MAIRPFNFYVEMEKNDYTPVGEVKQLDTMELDIKVLENSIPKNLESSEISLYVRKKDGTILEQKENISIVEASEGTIKIKVKNQATACAGMTLFELELKGADGIATTGTFIFVVNERVVNGEVVESKDEIHALVEVEKYVKLAKEELQRFKELQAEMLRTNETMNSQENLRNVAETERISAEEERKEKESERVESEGNRVTAEGLRANAEISRANAENSRERKERERVTAEVSRVDAEALRVSEEKKRVNAENSRANAERSRVDAESIRVAEEKKRVTAETARAENEDARVLAERNREENFSQFESKINKISSDMSKNTKEIKNARTATTGEDFNSLDERIDCEIDRLNKKIEVSLLQQEDKESHIIENTVEGVTSDMVVKGRTLNNLYKANNIREDAGGKYILVDTFEEYAPKDRVVYIVNNTNKILLLNVYKIGGGWDSNPIIRENSISKLDLTGKRLTGFLGMYDRGWVNNESDKETLRNTCIVLDREETYMPQEYFEGIKSFGQQENKISILSHNKNLINLNDISTNHSSVTFKKENDSITIEGESNSINWGCVQVIQFLKKGTYFFNYQATGNGYIRAVVYDAETLKSISSDIYPNRGREFTNDKDRKILIRLFLKGESADSKLINKYWDIQLEEGTQATTYEPPKSDKKDILLQNLGFDEGLRGFGLNVCDELNDIKNVAIKRVGKKIITSELPITLKSINVHGIANFAIPIDDLYKDRVGFCNKLILQDTLIADTITEGFTLSVGARGAFIRVKSEKASNVEEFKQYLATLDEPIVIYYPCEPVETPLDENINLKAFRERTYVGFKNAISGANSFKAPVDTVLALSNLTDGIKNKTDKKEADEINERATESLELSEYNHSDINDNIFPYLMDLELMVLDMMELNGYTNKKYKISERAGIHMTSKQALERLIRQKKVTLEDALDRIVRYNDAGRITDAEALELTDLAHEIL